MTVSMIGRNDGPRTQIRACDSVASCRALRAGWFVALAGLAIASSSLPAQQLGADGAGSARAADSSRTRLVAGVPRSTDPVTRSTLFTRSDAVLGAGFLVAVAAAVPFDRGLALESQEAELQTNRLVGTTATGFRVLGDPGAILLGASLFVGGRLSHRPRAADVGLHITEAVVLSGVATSLVKGVAGRARPYMVGDRRPGDFALWRGFVRGGSYSSFPSGHTTVAFAAAAVATDEIGRLWPNRQRIAGTVLYGSAAAVGLSRMYHDKHWASDVIAAAAVGTLVGRGVVRYQHSHAGNRLDRWLLHTSVAPRRDGFALAWSVR